MPFDGMTEDQIFAENEKLIGAVINARFIKMLPTFPYEDMYQEGAIGLLRAIRKYGQTDESKVKFSTYAWHNIYYAINRYCKNNRFLIRVPRSYQTRCYEEGADAVDEMIDTYSVDLIDDIAAEEISKSRTSMSAEEEYLDQLGLDECMSLIKQLSEKQQIMIKAYMENGFNATKAAKVLGLKNRQSVLRAVNNYKMLLKEKYQDLML